MDYLLENLTKLYEVSGWSYENLATKMKEGVPENEQFSKDQIRSYEQRLTTPKSHFKKVLSNFLKVSVEDLLGRVLSDREIEEAIKKKRNYLEYKDTESIVSDYKEKYLTALEEIRELQKQLLKKKNEENGDKPIRLKRAE